MDPGKALEAALTLTPAVRIDHTYLPNDFTLYLYRQPRVGSPTRSEDTHEDEPPKPKSGPRADRSPRATPGRPWSPSARTPTTSRSASVARSRSCTATAPGW